MQIADTAAEIMHLLPRQSGYKIHSQHLVQRLAWKTVAIQFYPQVTNTINHMLDVAKNAHLFFEIVVAFSGNGLYSTLRYLRQQFVVSGIKVKRRVLRKMTE